MKISERPARHSPRLALRFALREMRGGLSGFLIFLACIALGVAAIGGVNSVARSIADGVSQQGQVLLGGDMRFELAQRRASAGERTFLESLGTVSESASMRSMARRTDGADQALVELKAVDAAYPLYGGLRTAPPLPRAELFARKDGVFGAIAPDLLMQRLDLRLGDHIRLGDQDFELRALLTDEPDQISDGFAFAPRLMISLDGLAATGLIQPGSLVEFVYKLRLPADADAARLKAISGMAAAEFPEAGWSIRTRDNAAPALSSNIERFSQFLTLVGLASLVVGGVGVANAVRAYLDAKRSVIATFKSLGASARLIFAIYLSQIMIIAVAGIAIGLVIAAFMPFVAGAALASALNIPASGGFYPAALAIAALFGILVTLLFALLPLGHAQQVPASALFRESGVESRGLPGLPVTATVMVLALCLAVLAVWISDQRRIAVTFVAATMAAFLILRLVAQLLGWLARRAPRIPSTALRLAVGNIHRPGALTSSVVLSLGLGLTLLAALSLIDGNLRRQITDSLPERAPNFFFVDIQGSQIADFADLIQKEDPAGTLQRVPMLRGRITALNGEDTRNIKVPAEGAWVLRGDRGVTYAEARPDNATLTQGQWWPSDYEGEPLVSFSVDEAQALGLEVGDTITVNVLGRNLTARIANLRRVEWETLGINFVMVFSPNSFAGAPHAWLATLSDPAATTAEEARLLKAVTQAFPTVTTVRVKDAIEVVNRLVGQLAAAIRAAASVTLIASILVLSGALAAGNRARVHDAIVLKTLGATRRTLITAFSLEYMLIGLATAVFALAAGSAAAWFVLTSVMGLPMTLLPGVAIATVVLALVLTVGFGLIGTWRVLGHKAAPVLRNL